MKISFITLKPFSKGEPCHELSKSACTHDSSWPSQTRFQTRLSPSLALAFGTAREKSSRTNSSSPRCDLSQWTFCAGPGGGHRGHRDEGSWFQAPPLHRLMILPAKNKARPSPGDILLQESPAFFIFSASPICLAQSDFLVVVDTPQATFPRRI